MNKSANKKLIAIIVAVVVVVAIILFSVVGNGVEQRLEEKLQLGEQYLSELDYERAIAAYQAAIEIEEKCAPAYLALADIYLAMGDMEKALEVLEEGYAQTDSEEIERRLEELKVESITEEEPQGSESTEQNQIANSQEQENNNDEVQSVKGENENIDGGTTDDTGDVDENTGGNTEQKKQIMREEKTVHIETGYEWDLTGTTIKEYDKDGYLIYKERDGEERLNIVYDYHANGVPSVQYWYDISGILLEEVPFDEKGNIIREYTESGDAYYIYSYVYDENGRMIKKDAYYQEIETGEMSFFRCDTYEYDELGNMILLVTYDAELLPYYECHWQYNDKGQLDQYYVKNPIDDRIGLIVEMDESANSESTYRITWEGKSYLETFREFDENGNILNEINYDENGKEMDKYRYEYMYDESGAIIEEVVYMNEELYITIKREYY